MTHANALEDGGWSILTKLEAWLETGEGDVDQLDEMAGFIRYANAARRTDILERYLERRYDHTQKRINQDEAKGYIV